MGKAIRQHAIGTPMDRVAKVNHQGTVLSIVTPNNLCQYRADSFASKEPETLEWIDKIPLNSVIWDIGANVGLYSIYAAKKRNCTVFAFEPSVFNLELLARNIFLNDLTELINIIPVALNDNLKISHMRMTSTDWGGALSTFEKDFGWDGKSIKQAFDFKTLGISMEDAVEKLSIPLPDYIKIDVDGIEHLILAGGPQVLKSIKGILIEINDNFHEQSDQCEKILKDAGLVLAEKRHADIFDTEGTLGDGAIWNQIWIRE